MVATLCSETGQDLEGDFPDVLQDGTIADATAVEANEAKGIQAQKAVVWKQNGLRHSFASYKFALTNDAGQLAGMMGNSAAMIFKHSPRACEASRRGTLVCRPTGRPGQRSADGVR